MRGRFRPPALAVAAALLGLIALLATLQYRWLGRISDAERDRMTATLNARAAAFAQDFDRELTLAYMLFQVEPALPGAAVEQSLPARLASRYERWQATARYPKLIREVYVASREGDDGPRLERFNPATHLSEPVDWPDALAPIRGNLIETHEEKSANGTMVVRTIAPALWEQIPAVVVPSAPTPLLFLNSPSLHAAARRSPAASLTYTVLLLDRQVMVGEVLPALAAHHFRGSVDDTQYQVAVIDTSAAAPMYRSTPTFSRRDRAGRRHRGSVPGPAPGVSPGRGRCPTVHRARASWFGRSRRRPEHHDLFVAGRTAAVDDD